MNPQGIKKLEWLKEELKHNNFAETNVGKALYSFYEECLKISNCEPFILENFKEMVNKVFDSYPLTELSGDKDEMLEVVDQDGNKCLRNKRYDPVCSDFNDHTKFYDDEAITFIINGVKTHLYQNGVSSRRQINFPYYPTREYVYLNKNDELDSGTN